MKKQQVKSKKSKKVKKVKRHGFFVVIEEAVKGIAHVFMFEHFVPEKLTLIGATGYDVFAGLSLVAVAVVFIYARLKGEA